MPRLNLPTAKRTVQRGVGVCLRMGYTEAQALATIQAVCAAVAAGMPSGGDYDIRWLAEVQEVARCRLNRLQPPTP